ncbi:DUF935 domain-containing protein [Desulfocurvus vexinensis]|uniref:DUF935 domain-containing protein n=1 Tax=Desulfocurvus vexinensis TaxID=399548 RepID=UPI00049137E7|nr:DUF935 family protein [Desulfocurvus vexinensis]
MPDTKPDLAEYSAAGSDNLFSGYAAEILPNEDRVLTSLGGDLQEYAKLLRDEQVQSGMQQRRDAVIACELEVVPGGNGKRDKMAADALKEMLAALAFDRKTRMMLMGVYYGYAVAECIWGRDGKSVVLEEIKVRKPWRFGFDRDGGLRLLKAGHPSGLVMPDRKFWTFSAGADDDDSPYGRGLAHFLWWPVFLKRNGAKFWAQFLDRFGSPHTKATYPANATDEQKRTAMEAAKALRSGGVTAFPDGFDVALVEATGNGKGNYEGFLKYWDSAISKVILSQTATTEAGPYVGTANVHGQVRREVIKSDADLCCESFNGGVARWLTEWNYPGAVPPQIWRVNQDVEKDKAVIERDEKLYSIGLELTDDAVRERYGDGYRRRAVLAGEAGASFAEAGDAHADPDDAELLAEQLDVVSAPSMQAVVDRVRQLVMSPDVVSLDELGQCLVELYPELDMSDLASLLADAMALSELQGMDALNERR